MEIIANPSAESLKVIVWLLIAVLSILVAVVAFFIVFGITWVKNSLERLSNSFGEITTAITELKMTVSEVRAKFEVGNPIIIKRLDCHSKKLERHNGQLKILMVEHRIIHKKCLKIENQETSE
jgi:hypothetical protein